MESIANTGVFDRTGRDEMSTGGFYATMTLSLFWGLIGTAVAAYMSVQSGFTPNFWQILILGLGLPIAGVLLAVTNDNPALSFIGYNMILIPFGVILGPVLNKYSPDVIRDAFAITAVITLVMGFAGTTFPAIFRNMGAPLFLALGALLIVRIAQIFIPALNFGLVDYIAAGIFSLYIGYDMYRASEVPKTIDNAIDISVDLYLDILNLFLNLLKLLGSKSDD